MSILMDQNTRLIVQGITGRLGSIHTIRCIEYGTNIVGGVTPGRGNSLFAEKIPVFDSVEEAVNKTGANASVIFVPPAFAVEAIIESAEAGIPLVICITEGIPIMDMTKCLSYLATKTTRLIGPNCPGVMSPSAKCTAGIIPIDISTPGNVGVVSRSGTLTYLSINQLTKLGIGQSTCVGIGGDPLVGTSFIDILQCFQEDCETDAVVLIGEIGGTEEQKAAEYIKDKFTKPVISLVVGQTAPKGKRMGHAGAIIEQISSRADDKTMALEKAGCIIAQSPAVIGLTTQKVLASL